MWRKYYPIEDENKTLFEEQVSLDYMNWLGEEGDMVHSTQRDYEESLGMNNQLLVPNEEK